jgi:hypothetical protein
VRWFGFASIVLVAACTSAAAPPAADRLAAEMKSESARPVVRRLWESGEYDRVLDRIAAGDSAFIALSPQLAAGADAGAAEGLGVALARALPKNALAVVSVLDRRRPAISPARVCGLPFVEGADIDVAGYRREAEAAVERVDGASLQDLKAACLTALRRP